ncbi:hypothetical protein I4U23_029359 [Adineta vaga]|nr:hypothetical protein I4U23_029359 [Adineta vaga]
MKPMDDDCLKIFLSNLNGQINTEDIHRFFDHFGTIEHIESWTPKSAIILFSDEKSIDRVLSKHRKCTINKQEIFIRRIRHGYIDRAYMDSSVLFIKAFNLDSSLTWNDERIRKCFHEYETYIKEIRIVSKSCHAFIHFDDYDIVDRILLQIDVFKIDGNKLEMKRAKCHTKQMEEDECYVQKLVKENQILKRKIERLEIDSHDEMKHLKHKIRKLKQELVYFASRHHN